MNRDDIIRMAREAGAGEWGDSVIPAMMDIERFAKLVAAAERDRIADESKHIIKRAEARGAAAEREACAQVCEAERGRLFWVHNVQAISADKLAEAIRARGEK